ncbi:hypothetical protein [Oceanibaculum nanhaiense]|uniref:hypothetical protein n=1 Tax=Oceanibaculum nanhaiense TaxID=1909734 RepID=UPI0025A46A5D|nr:hypothetical protein [Oceanibaculum nanhaiense]MDM7945269.1 hypothetical protein [Oceanibaculum nanhaiense]
MDRIKTCAEISVRRGTAFALLAVGTLMVAFSFDVALSLKMGAATMIIMAAILAYRAMMAASTDYRRTETWLLLGKAHPLPESRRQKVIGSTLRDIYQRYARYSAGGAFSLWLASLVIPLIR